MFSRSFLLSLFLVFPSFGVWAHGPDQPAELPFSPIKKYRDVVNKLESLAVKHADQVELFDLGVSDNGEVIKGIKIGSGSVHNLVVATHHGNEYGSTEVAEAFAEDLAQNPIVGQTVYVIPVLNTWGYDRRNRREMAKGQTFEPLRHGRSLSFKKHEGSGGLS
jgi:hypothetical protein